MKNLNHFVVLTVFALCLAATQMAHAAEDRNTKIKAEMVQNYLLWQEAYKNKDTARIISFESPDFTSVSKNGQVRSKEMADTDWRDGMKLIKKVHAAQVEIKKLTIEPHRVVILSKQYLDVDMLGPNNQLDRVSIILHARDIWVEYDQSWMLKRTEDISQKFLVNGKPEF